MSPDDLYVVPLAPAYNDGRMRESDVVTATAGLPWAAPVRIVLDEADDFEAGAPRRLAHALLGSVVQFEIGANARGIAADFRTSFDRASAELLAVEAGRLA